MANITKTQKPKIIMGSRQLNPVLDDIKGKWKISMSIKQKTKTKKTHKKKRIPDVVRNVFCQDRSLSIKYRLFLTVTGGSNETRTSELVLIFSASAFLTQTRWPCMGYSLGDFNLGGINRHLRFFFPNDPLKTYTISHHL